MDSSAVSARLIGAIFVEKGLVTEEQLERALAQQRASGDRLGEILVEQFGIERLDLASALAEQWAEYERQGAAEERESQSVRHDPDSSGEAHSDEQQILAASAKRPIGEIFVERGLVTEDQLEEALDQQKKGGGRLGEILVAGGRLSRLELASALADQWASFQKLRPPADAPPVDTQPAPSQPLPTPDVAPPAPTPQATAPSPEVLQRVDALASRVDQLATDKSDWKPQLEKVAELLRARLEHLEEAVSRRPGSEAHELTGGGTDEVRAEIAALASRIEAIPTQTHEWRYELSQVADNLRTRLEHVETSLEDAPAGGQLAELRTQVDRLSARIDSLPTPSEEWHHALADLAARMDALPVSLDEWRDAVAELSTRIDSLPAPSDEWRHAVTELAARMDALPVPSDEWRDAVAELSVRVDLLPVPSEEWRQGVAQLSARMDALPVASDEWRDAVADLSARIDSLPVASGEWRRAVSSLEEKVAEIGQPAGEAAELRASLEALVAKVETLPLDAWRSELAEVAQNLRTRVERVEHGLDGATGSEEIAELRASLDALSARVSSLPVPSEEWRDQIDVLAARIDALPVASDEWRDVVSELAGRIDSLPLDAWRSELAEVAQNLRTRVERVEHGFDGATGSEEIAELRASLDALSARVSALPVPSEEWRDQIDVLAARIDALPVASDEWRDAVADLSARIDSLPVASDEWRRAVSSLEEKVAEIGQPAGEAAELRASLEALVAQVESLPLDAWRSELAEVAQNLRTRVERVEHGFDGATGSEEIAELRASLDALSARVSSLPVPSEEWRNQIDVLAARIDGLTTDLRPELVELAEGLRKRIERIEEGMSGQARAAAVTQIAERVDELARKIAETDAVESRMHALTARIEALPVSSDDWREEVAALAARFDSLPVPSDEWRDQIGALAARIDALRTDEWKAELAHVAENLRTRLERVEQQFGGVHAERFEDLRARLGDLETRLDAAPVPVDEIRSEIAGLAQTLHGRVEQLEHRLSREVRAEVLDGLSARIEEIAAQTDDTSAVEARLNESLSALIDERAERLTAEAEDVRGRLDDALSRFEPVAGVIGRLDDVESRLGSDAVSVAAFAPRLDELQASGDRSSSRLEMVARRLEELAARGDATEVEQALTQRIDSAEALLGDLRFGLDRLSELPSSVEERIGAVQAQIEASTGQGTAEVESLRRELHDLRAVVNGAGEALTGRIDSVAESLRDEFSATAERFVASDDLDELRSAIERHDSRLEGFGGELADFGRRADEKTNARAAELDVLRTRLDTVESALVASRAWPEAVDATHARIEKLEVHVEEFSAAEAVERNAEIESVRGQLSDRIEALESAQVKRKDVRELRDTVVRVERRVDERLAQDDAAVRATEEAVREGIASLGERLSASGDAYLETGRELSRSIAGLGLALTAAEAHGGDAPRSTDRPTEISVFLAFAPTREGYRLVECAGAAPSLDDEVNIEGSEGPLVVTRIGASPLPFDVRPCVYLERS